MKKALEIFKDFGMGLLIGSPFLLLPLVEFLKERM